MDTPDSTPKPPMPTSVENPAPAGPPNEGNSRVSGLLVAIAIFVVIIIAGIWYIASQTNNNQGPTNDLSVETTEMPKTAATITPDAGSSTEIKTDTDLDATLNDIDSTDVDQLDKDSADNENDLNSF